MILDGREKGGGGLTGIHPVLLSLGNSMCMLSGKILILHTLRLFLAYSVLNATNTLLNIFHN